MTTRTNDQPSPTLQLLSDRVTTHKTVKAMLDSADVNIRMLKYELVITNPLDKDKSSVRIEYGTGHVSLRRVVRDYWGPLQGYADEENSLPYVTADRILTALGADFQKSEPSS